MGLQVDELWREEALPFVTEHPKHFRTPPGGDIVDMHGLYLWATAMVAAYSFELGEDKFQVRAVLCLQT
jgi:hypothetical protein